MAAVLAAALAATGSTAATATATATATTAAPAAEPDAPFEVTVAVAGTIEVVMVELGEGTPEGADQQVAVSLLNVDGRLFALPDAVAPAEVSTGDSVVVTVQTDPALSVPEALEESATVEPDDTARIVDVAVSSAGVTPAEDGPVLEATLGVHTLTVLPVYWGSGPDVSTKTSLRGIADATQQYWSEQSGGRLQIVPDVRDWVSIPNLGSGCDAGLSSRVWNAALAAHGVAGSSTQNHVLIYFPRVAACGWAGQASVGGGAIWINGSTVVDVMAHEFGHNLGLGHANLALCTGGNGARVPLALPVDVYCSQQEYGDRADVMGIGMSAPTGNLNSAFADYLGLARVTDVTAVTPGTTVHLAPLADAAGMRALRLTIPGGAVYIDYRPAVGRDVRVPAWAGVQVHLRLTEGRIPVTYLLDMQPTFPAAFAEADLPLGASWDVPGAGARLTVTGTGASAQLTVGAMDDQTSRYVTKVYRDLFDRGPDPVGLQGWSTALRTGTPRIAVANAITYSDEYRLRLITASYQTYLGRGPDPSGHLAWLGQMRIGATIQQMEAGFLASAEYYAKGGGTDAGWVNRLYGHVLGRGANPSEIQSWVTALQSGGDRYRVAMGFLMSTEHLSAVVNDYYLDLLGRGIDPTGRHGWVVAIQAGSRTEQIIGGIIASGEYFGKS